MSDRLELSAFEPHVGEVFTLAAGEAGIVEVTLVEAAPSPWQPGPDTGLPLAYSLVFRGPADFVLPQRTYEIKHPVLGDVAIFVTPIAGTPEGVDYQAVFS